MITLNEAKEVYEEKEKQKQIATQYQMVKEHLESGKTLTRLEALTELGILNPTAVIASLRQDGLPIETRMIRVRNRWDAVCKVGQWYIREQDKPLTKPNNAAR